MIEWSETDVAIRDAARKFVDKEIRPHLDELETMPWWTGWRPPAPAPCGIGATLVEARTLGREAIGVEYEACGRAAGLLPVARHVAGRGRSRRRPHG